MHEYSLVTNILSKAEAEARARNAVAVRRLSLRVGELSGVEPDLLRSAFELASEATLCAGAVLAIERVAIRWECPSCHAVVPVGETLACPACGVAARLVAGGELILDKIELEVP